MSCAVAATRKMHRRGIKIGRWPNPSCIVYCDGMSAHECSSPLRWTLVQTHEIDRNTPRHMHETQLSSNNKNSEFVCNCAHAQIITSANWKSVIDVDGIEFNWCLSNKQWNLGWSCTDVFCWPSTRLYHSTDNRTEWVIEWIHLIGTYRIFGHKCSKDGLPVIVLGSCTRVFLFPWNANTHWSSIDGHIFYDNRLKFNSFEIK